MIVHRREDLGQPRKRRLKPTSDCPYCSEISDMKVEELVEHVKTEHGKEAPYGCKDCNKTFPSPDSLMSHKNRLHIPATCDVCGLSVANNHKLKMHLLIHGEKKYKCDRCDYASNFKQVLVKHMAKLHDTECEKMCDVCGQSFTSEKRFQLHEMSHLDKQFKCPADGCMYATTSDELLKKHKRHIYLGAGNNLGPKSMIKKQQKPYNCPYCEFSGAESGTYLKGLLNHIEKEHDIRGPYPCRDCGKTCVTPGTLILHLRTHTQTMCEFCGISTSISDIRRHMSVKHPAEVAAKKNANGEEGEADKSQQQQKKIGGYCPYCEFRATSKKNHVKELIAHIKDIHHEEAPFPCRSCDRKCSTPVYLIQHQVLHTQSMCELCGITTTVRDMKKHLSLKHAIADGNYNQCTCAMEGCAFTGSHSELSDHMKTVHKKGEHFTCLDCQASLETKEAYLKHCLDEHAKTDPLKCELCGKDFKYPQD